MADRIDGAFDRLQSTGQVSRAEPNEENRRIAAERRDEAAEAERQRREVERQQALAEAQRTRDRGGIDTFA